MALLVFACLCLSLPVFSCLFLSFPVFALALPWLYHWLYHWLCPGFTLGFALALPLALAFNMDTKYIFFLYSPPASMITVKHTENNQIFTSIGFCHHRCQDIHML
jgi:hypothetical protein